MADYGYWGLPNKDTKDIDVSFVRNHKYQSFKWFKQDIGIANQHKRDGVGPKSEDVDPVMNSRILTHVTQEKFHRDRAFLFLEMLKGLANIPDPEARTSPNKVPSMYDKLKDGALHNPEEGLMYHSQLIAESIIHASRARALAEACKTEDVDADGWLTLANSYGALTDLHRSYMETYSQLLGPQSDLTGPTDMRYLSVP